KSVSFAERRKGVDRRQTPRRGLKRRLLQVWRLSTYRRRWIRRAPYIRRETYTVYLPERV
ncbi:MAG: hypothetical protein QMB60_04985, partial [Pseudomonadales bacterium]